jgi:hypothetical protein
VHSRTCSDPDTAPPTGHKIDHAARLLGQRVAGWERSAKWALISGRVDSTRRVLGFRTEGLDDAAWAAALAALDAPRVAVDVLGAHLHEANFGYLATEAGGGKAYLEFPVRLNRIDAWGRMRPAPPGLWARAAKWRFGEPLLRHTEYWLVPGATLAGLDRQLRTSDSGHPMIGMLASLLERRPRASADPDMVTLYEVRHGDGARAWDLNIYGLHCSVDQRLIDAFGWPEVPADARGASLGHVAAGYDRDGEPYRSVYWRADQPR